MDGFNPFETLRDAASYLFNIRGAGLLLCSGGIMLIWIGRLSHKPRDSVLLVVKKKKHPSKQPPIRLTRVRED